MEEKKRSWNRHLSRLREKGWAQSRQETSPLEVVASKTADLDEEDDLAIACSGDESFPNPPRGPDTLDFVFETIEGYICGHYSVRSLQGDWDHDYAGRGHINESKSEVWSLYKLGEVQKRSSVADRIKAFEANNAPTSPIRASDGRPANRSQAEPRSTSPVSRWRKSTDQQSPRSPRSWQRSQMEHSPTTPDSLQRSQMKSSSGSPNSWQRQQMEKSHGTPNSWQKAQMERSPGSLPSWMSEMEKSPKTPHSDVARPSNKVSMPLRNANSAFGTKSEKKQPIPAWPTKLKNAPRKPSSRDSIIVRILKDSETESSGLSFVSYYEKEGIYVSKIRRTSKFKNTELKRGMKVLRINGVRCPGRVKNVIKMLKSAKTVIEIEATKDDSIEFVAREKPTSEQTKEKKNGSSVEPRRSRSPSKRERHQEENSDENKKAEDEAMGFTDQLMLSMGYVPQTTIVESQKANEEKPIERKDSSASIASLDRSEIPEKPKNKKVHAMVFKRTRRDKIGISFVSFKKKRGVYIYEMYEDSKFQRTGLEVGMKVLAINRQPCPERVSETLAMVKDIEGQLIISAVAPSDEYTSTEPIRGGADGMPKVQTLNKLGKKKLRKYQRKSRDVVHEEPKVAEGEILNRSERIKILEDHSWLEDEYADRQMTSSFSQASHTTSSSEMAEEDDDNDSLLSGWGSTLASVFGS